MVRILRYVFGLPGVYYLTDLLLKSSAGCWESTFIFTYDQVHRQPTREFAPPSLERPSMTNLALVELSQTFDCIVLEDCYAFA